MEKKYLQLNNIDAYRTSFNLSNYVWVIVVKWDLFAKKHIGGQFVEAIDSILQILQRVLAWKQNVWVI